MSTAYSIPVSEYLSKIYRPDCDYVDGQIVGRNVGEWDHSRLQLKLGSYLLQYEASSSLFAATEQRVQVKPTRYRVPDITVMLGKPDEPVMTRPPFICIEVLSTRDTLTSIQDRIDDYLDFGVPNVWIVDPHKRVAFIADAFGVREVPSGILETEGIPLRINMADFWS